jgi:hypothetical protein
MGKLMEDFEVHLVSLAHPGTTISLCNMYLPCRECVILIAFRGSVDGNRVSYCGRKSSQYVLIQASIRCTSMGWSGVDRERVSIISFALGNPFTESLIVVACNGLLCPKGV